MQKMKELRLECLRLAVAADMGDPIWLAQRMLEFVFESPLDDSPTITGSYGLCLLKKLKALFASFCSSRSSA